MPKANVNDRSSVETAYDRAAFDQDAARNTQGNASVLHGIKILSEPDSDGAFDLARATQHVGEGDPEGDTIFLIPRRERPSEAVDGGTYGGSIAPTPPIVSKDRDDYRDFISEVCENVSKARFKPDIGVGESRLKGFRGG